MKERQVKCLSEDTNILSDSRESNDVDAKINTLESEDKCSPSSGKSTKRASQFDLQLTRDKKKLNLRVYQLEFRISLIQIVSASSADRKNDKRILNAGAE